MFRYVQCLQGPREIENVGYCVLCVYNKHIVLNKIAYKKQT